MDQYVMETATAEDLYCGVAPPLNIRHVPELNVPKTGFWRRLVSLMPI